MFNEHGIVSNCIAIQIDGGDIIEYLNGSHYYAYGFIGSNNDFCNLPIDVEFESELIIYGTNGSGSYPQYLNVLGALE